jgi:hypothetical protein
VLAAAGRLRGGLSDDILEAPHEAIFLFRRKTPERLSAQHAGRDQRRSSIMWGYLLSFIYHLSCRTTLYEIGTHHLAR